MDIQKIIEALPEVRELIQSHKKQYDSLLDDYNNLKNRVQKERVEMAKYQDEHLLKVIAPAFDNMWHAMYNSNYTHIIKPIFIPFCQMLASVGIQTLIPKKGEEFNENEMDAISTAPSPSSKYNNTVQHCFSPGFSIHDKIVIYPKVIVYQHEF